MRAKLGKSYENALAVHRPALPQLSSEDRAVVGSLNDKGYYVTSLDALGLPNSQEMLARAQRAAANSLASVRAEAAKGRDFTFVPPSVIAANPAIFTWGLDERLLDIVETYLGLPVAYDGLNILYTAADGRAVASRQWHRDREDRKMVKVAVYLHDVVDGGGPLQVISRIDQTQSDADGYFYELGVPEVLASLLGPDYQKDIVTLPGSAGTVIFLDTARYFHRGEPAHVKDRVAVFYSYFAQRTRHPFFCHRSGLRREDLEHLTQGLTRRQRASTFWFDQAKRLVRMIPPAPV